MAEDNDINDPVLVIVARGRKGRGYTVTPADSDTPYPCMSAEDVGEAIIEILDDPEQARVQANTVGQKGESQEEASASGGEEKPPPEPDDDDEEYEENPYPQGDAYESMDPVDKAIVGGLQWLINGARKASDYKRRRR